MSKRNPKTPKDDSEQNLWKVTYEVTAPTGRKWKRSTTLRGPLSKAKGEGRNRIRSLFPHSHRIRVVSAERNKAKERLLLLGQLSPWQAEG